MRAWNLIVSQRLQYADLQRTAARDEDTQVRYRANEMLRLIVEVDRTCDYELSLKVLDHIEVTPEGKLTVIFWPEREFRFDGWHAHMASSLTEAYLSLKLQRQYVGIYL